MTIQTATWLLFLVNAVTVGVLIHKAKQACSLNHVFDDIHGGLENKASILLFYLASAGAAIALAVPTAGLIYYCQAYNYATVFFLLYSFAVVLGYEQTDLKDVSIGMAFLLLIIANALFCTGLIMGLRAMTT